MGDINTYAKVHRVENVKGTMHTRSSFFLVFLAAGGEAARLSGPSSSSSSQTCDILMRLSVMQHPQPDLYPEFPLQPQRHSRDFQQQEMITDHPLDLRFLQPTDPSMNASAARDSYSIPITTDQRPLANSASALS